MFSKEIQKMHNVGTMHAGQKDIPKIVRKYPLKLLLFSKSLEKKYKRIILMTLILIMIMFFTWRPTMEDYTQS